MTSGNSLPSHLLATKLSVPPARTQLVARPRLFGRLEAGLRRRMTLIAAPAGFGKTTLLSAWRPTPSGSRLAFGWISLDSGDNDPLLFWSYFLAALDMTASGVGAPALAALQTAQPPPIENVLTGMLNAFAGHAANQPGRGVALVL